MGNYTSGGEKYVKKYVATPGNVIINPCRPEKPQSIIRRINEQKPQFLRGEVMNLWPGADLFDLEIEKGDMVYFLTGNATEIPYMETVLLVVPYDNLMLKE